MIQLQDLQVKYDNTVGPVLDQVNLTIHNEKAVIVGPNGSGKTTLFKALLGLIPITKGTRKLFGKDSNEIKGFTNIATNMIDVYQLVYLPVKDIIKIFADLKKCDPQKAFDLFEYFGFQEIYKKRLHNLSMGQQKMFGNIMAISFSPQLILFDEPFENVDQNRKHKFIDILKKLDSEVLIITHEFSLLDRLSDYFLYFMLDGKIWGKFGITQLNRLYITRGEAKDALTVMETSLGKLSVTLDYGDIAVKTATNLNTILDRM